ncbi:MAG: acyl-CoA dehydratase activase-related protein [Bacillota bacterium]
MPKVGIPRAFSYYYFYPFYRGFLKALGAEVVVSPRSSRRTLDLMQTCPTDEPCVSVKLCFAHAAWLRSAGVDFFFLPYMVSVDAANYLCPKMIGITDMVRVGLGLPDDVVLAPVLDRKDRPSAWQDTFREVAARLGVEGPQRVRAALEAGEAEQARFRSLCCQGLTVPEAIARLEGREPPGRRRYSSRVRHDPGLRIGVAGHAYLLYDLIGHDVVSRLREYGQVATAEMVDDESARREMATIFEGEKMWYIEAHLLGAVLHWLRNRLVDKLVLVQAFECGPMSVVENFVQEEADACGIPLLILTVDEQTGEAGLVTRLEAFMDTSPVADSRTLRVSPLLHTTVFPRRGPEPRHLKAGVVTMGSLDVGVRAMLEECGVEVVRLPRLGKETVDLGKELAPEFICFPMVTLLGEMRHLLDRGANMLLMVMGKGRCRLGWYAQVQELLLGRYGYRFEMPAFNSPVPLRSNWAPFARVVRHVAGGASWPRIISAFRFGWRKVVLTDRGERLLHRWRAFEEERGAADRAYQRFLGRLDRASSYREMNRAWDDFRAELEAIPTLDTDPLHVRVLGEIYVLLEPLVNKDLEKIVGTRVEQRVWVHRELCASEWFRLHVFRDRNLRRREEYVRHAAWPYLRELVGGHGTESVGGAVLAPREGMDGVLHLMPFTCMPEIVAQNVLVRAADEHDIPILTFIMSEQTGEAGIITRVEAFLDLLEERRRARRSVTREPARWPTGRAEWQAGGVR